MRTTYTVRELDNGESVDIAADTLGGAIVEAERWVREGVTGTDDATQWVDYDIHLDGQEVHSGTVVIHPEEPDCTDETGGGHVWGDPERIGVDAGEVTRGGDCRHYEACLICGCDRETHRYVDHHALGGPTRVTVSYRPGRWASEAAKARGVRSERLARDILDGLSAGDLVVMGRRGISEWGDSVVAEIDARVDDPRLYDAGVVLGYIEATVDQE